MKCFSKKFCTWGQIIMIFTFKGHAKGLWVTRPKLAHLKVLLEWIQLQYDMVTLFVQNNVQKPECKIRSKSRDIDENDIVQWLGETFGIFRRLAAEWRQLVFVYDVIREHGDSNKRRRQRRFKPLQETGVEKMINGNVPEFISLWFASVHGAVSCIQNCVLPLVLRLQKV